MNRYPLPLLLIVLLAGVPRGAVAQAVAVTMSLDSGAIAVGSNTTLRVFAQVVPALRSNSDRIFSWYVNVLNTNGAVASANYAALQKIASDNDPQTSSTGFTTNANRFAIYDTFLGLTGAGVSNAVELMAIPVTATASGMTEFRVLAGSGVPELSEDFIVAPLGGDDPLTGGDYSAAVLQLQVVAECDLNLQISPVNGGGPGQTLLLTFTPCAGYNHTVEARSTLNGGSWQALPGTPHNSGSVTVTNATSTRFFRVAASPQ
jgi:hypothetical protein